MESVRMKTLKNKTKLKKKTKSLWQPMSTAPKDGTMILITEVLLHDDVTQVVPAVWMAFDPMSHHKMGPQPDNESKGAWCGLCVSRSSFEGPLYTRISPLAITPVCWRPFPEKEDVKKLKRRLSMLLHHEYKNKK
jgi:hypothetical protein